jgi:hypothetical protein
MYKTITDVVLSVTEQCKSVCCKRYKIKCTIGVVLTLANQPKYRHTPPPYNKCSAILAKDFGKFSQGPKPDFKSLA